MAIKFFNTLSRTKKDINPNLNFRKYIPYHRYENIHVHDFEIEIEKVYEVKNELFSQTSLTRIWHDITVINDPYENSIKGKLYILLKSYTDNCSLQLFLSSSFILKGYVEMNNAATLNTFIHYLFTNVYDYAIENKIKDKNGNWFICPPNNYSVQDFEKYFV